MGLIAYKYTVLKAILPIFHNMYRKPLELGLWVRPVFRRNGKRVRKSD